MLPEGQRCILYYVQVYRDCGKIQAVDFILNEKDLPASGSWLSLVQVYAGITRFLPYTVTTYFSIVNRSAAAFDADSSHLSRSTTFSLGKIFPLPATYFPSHAIIVVRAEYAGNRKDKLH
jgi:hypothetical protein